MKYSHFSLSKQREKVEERTVQTLPPPSSNVIHDISASPLCLMQLSAASVPVFLITRIFSLPSYWTSSASICFFPGPHNSNLFLFWSPLEQKGFLSASQQMDQQQRNSSCFFIGPRQMFGADNWSLREELGPLPIWINVINAALN